ncbi:MAG: type II toxin-antitoxin system PemK/MazF family toxin [Bacteroidetes bacterium]|nr:type II toxin-antitoxin system PemK/MazF family toxin [Bacteroidota bacterium]
MTIKAKQFEIWIADLNPTIGIEPGKVRPVIIIQTDLLNKHHPSSLICPITTTVKKEIEILRIHLKKGCCGLEEGCDIMIDQIRAIDNKRLIKKAGNIPAEVERQIKENLKIIFDIE